MARPVHPLPTPIPPEKPSASAAFIPETRSLATLHRAAEDCTGCDLFKRGTQVVFGEGPKDARLVLIGEQPGDQEDLAGRPFVGPAGALLARILEDVQIDRDEIYVTNAVKHFKWEPRGKRRIHVKPTTTEVHACRGWLLAELAVIKPAMIVCLGATAAQSFLGRKFSILKMRGEVFNNTPWAPWFMATYHPSALLRIPEEADRAEAHINFTADLRLAAKALAEQAHPRRARAS